MGIYRGLNIVTDGLVFCVDPGSQRSYSGAGSTMYDLSKSKLSSSVGTFVSAGNNKGYYLNSNVSTTTSTASTDILNTDYHTICLLFRMASNGTYPAGTTGDWNKIFGYEPSGTDRSPGIWRFPSNRRIHWTYNPGNTATDFGPSGLATDFDLNKDYYVIMMKDGANTYFWVNGTKFTGITTCANPKVSGNSATIHNKSLTADEISQTFNTLKKRFNI